MSFKEDIKGLAIVIAIWALSMFLWDCIPQKDTPNYEYTEEEYQELQYEIEQLEEELFDKEAELCELKKDNSEFCTEILKLKKLELNLGT